MKKVKYIGNLEALVPTLNVVVKNGDVIDVPDDFNNVYFEEVKDDTGKSKQKGDDK